MKLVLIKIKNIIAAIKDFFCPAEPEIKAPEEKPLAPRVEQPRDEVPADFEIIKKKRETVEFHKKYKAPHEPHKKSKKKKTNIKGSDRPTTSTKRASSKKKTSMKLKSFLMVSLFFLGSLSFAGCCKHSCCKKAKKWSPLSMEKIRTHLHLIVKKHSDDTSVNES